MMLVIGQVHVLSYLIFVYSKLFTCLPISPLLSQNLILLQKRIVKIVDRERLYIVYVSREPSLGFLLVPLLVYHFCIHSNILYFALIGKINGLKSQLN